jgi:putative DNA primase/helicase
LNAACLCLFGGIQPARLQTYLADAVTGGPNDDGLMQRFQVLVWPDHSREWVNVDRAPNRKAQEAANGIFERLFTVMCSAMRILFSFQRIMLPF